MIVSIEELRKQAEANPPDESTPPDEIFSIEEPIPPKRHEKYQDAVVNRLQVIADNTSAIKGWITFIGILIIVGLVAQLIAVFLQL